MGYLCDTSVLSHIAPGRAARQAWLERWFIDNADDLYVPTVVVFEIEQGICKLRRAGGVARADLLSEWIRTLLSIFDDRVVNFDAAIAFMAGAMSERLTATGQNPGFADVVIAATAQHGAHRILTRNARHFSHSGLDVIDPFTPEGAALLGVAGSE